MSFGICKLPTVYEHLCAMWDIKPDGFLVGGRLFLL